MMKWEKLIVPYRYERDAGELKPDRTEFEKDFDRVVFSAAFRRLQDKTQVVPLPESDFVHTRLTHSLEASSVGRSLGRKAGIELLKKYPGLGANFSAYDIGSIVAAACLAHDIGNPPFGHSGEAAISEYFINGPGKKFRDEVKDEKKWADFTRFEGNANGFKILCNYSGNPRGLHLTYPTLAAFTKYPKESLPRYDSKRASEKKFGFFQSEKSQFVMLAEKLELLRYRDDENLNWCRHPLAFLVEAADDICYSIIDFEDGLNLKLIDFAYAREFLIPFLASFDSQKFERMNRNEQIGFLRANAISRLTDELAEIFVRNEEEMLNGTFDQALINLSEFAPLVKRIKEISREQVYKSRQVLEIEAAGFEVVGGLLDCCIGAVNHQYEKIQNPERVYHQSGKILELIPEVFIGTDKKPSSDLYERLMKICEFVAGMTDRSAISLYRKLKGIQLPG